MSVPSVIALAGSDKFRCRRAVRKHTETKVSEGWMVVQADGSQPGDVYRAVSSGVFQTGYQLVVVTHPAKLDLEFLKGFQSEKTVLFLVQEGAYDKRTKYYKFVKELPAKQRLDFNLPAKPWELEAYAVEFVKAEVKDHGKIIDDTLAQSVVKLIGTDLGTLSFEVLKASVLATEEGSQTITKDHLRGTLANITEASLMPLSDALAAKNPRQVARNLKWIRETRKSDPTIGTCRFLWKASVSKWIAVGAVVHQGVPETDIADLLGLNSWYCSRKLLPVVKTWGWEGLTGLVRILADSEQKVFTGCLNPWRSFQSRLLRAVVGSSATDSPSIVA